MISKLRTLAALVVFAAASVQSQTGRADEGCGRCRALGRTRCDVACPKVCRPVERIKFVPYVVWEVVCEDICLAGKSCGCQGTCGKVRTVKRLVRRTITKQVPVTECVVRPNCDCGAGHESPELPIPTPSARQPQPRLLYLRSAERRQQPIGLVSPVVPAAHVSIEREAPAERSSLWSLFTK